MKTNTDHTIPQRLRNPTRPDSPIQERQDSFDLTTKQSASTTDVAKDKKKGVSFLSRLSMRGGRKKEDGANDEESEPSERRTDGNDAPVFSSSLASGYIPHHKEPPRYIRVKAHNKKNREFDRMFLAQQLIGIPLPKDDNGKKGPNTTVPISGAGKRGSIAGGAIWSIEFSKDGKYLAAAGRDQVVRVWAVISTREERRAHEEEESSHGGDAERLSAPVFMSKPIREFIGHTGEVLDLSWSKNNFLLSSSMDKTVRLWHMSRTQCLCTFSHKDFVTSISFHPTDDRFFLAGSLDSTLRLWSIPDKAVAYSVQLPDLVTAVAFTPDGKTSIAGVLSGLCMFYDTEELKYQTQIHVRSSRGKNAKGSKITGIETMAIPPNQSDGDVKVLITSNDSRIRIYSLRDKNLEMKLKGHENTCSQIHASFSDDAKYIICGSEDRKAFIWSTSSTDSENKDKRPCECYDAHSDRVTGAVFAPTKSRQLLGGSGDPIYDLCNPPPVTLLSREEVTVSRTALSDGQSLDTLAHVKKPEESPGYIARSTHYDGNIVVTADQTGIIKVFRQDCAYVKRRHENWETGSTFSKKLTTGSGLVGRSASIVTRTSASSHPHSRRGSVSQSGAAPTGQAGTPQHSSDRIISWRQGIESGRSGSIGGTPTRSERSLSPTKATRTPINTSAANLASEARRQPYVSSSPLMRHQPTSPTSSIHSKTLDRPKLRDGPSQPPTPSFSFRSMEEDSDDLRLDPAGASYSFWNLSRWRGISSLRNSTSSNPPATGTSVLQKQSSHTRSNSDAVVQVSSTSDATDKVSRRQSLIMGSDSKMASQNEQERFGRRRSLGDETVPADDDSHLAPSDASPYVRGNSIVSRLSSEFTSEDGEGEGEGEQMTCLKCGGQEFKAKKVGGKPRLLCSKCGKLVDEDVKKVR
jgi:WD repeat-containing protein 44